MDVRTWGAIKGPVQDALERPAAEREGYLVSVLSGDPASCDQAIALVRAEAMAANLVDPPANGFALPVEALEIPESDDEPPPAMIGPYRVLERLGRGGMGAVYLGARDENEFRQVVAIKLVRRGMDTDDVLRRFRAERQILANLNHPYIARLLDGGSTSDGRPFFVMERVEGEPLDVYCERRDLPTAERVRLFRRVCEAIQAAHQNLVVHRDLKPGNILVTAEGAPKLLDFGIAKLLDTAASEGTALVRAMTPEYASPEQARGAPITTASDVYSAGVVLYRILTGELPHHFANLSGAALERAITGTEAVKPSAVVGRRQPDTERDRLRRSLEGDLDTIVLKALRKDPTRRYASIEQLSEDLQRHLEGLPVRARPDTIGYRASKFLRRHRAAALAASIAVVALLAGLVAALWQAHVARREGARADRRFAEVRQLARAILFDVHDSIAELPGAMPARELIVRQALEYLARLAIEAGDDPALLAELAEAYTRVGDVQGMPYWSSLGRSEDALRSYEKALELRDALLRRDPTDAAARLSRALVEGKIAAIHAAQGEPRRALERHRSALSEVTDLWQGHRFDPARLELAVLSVAVGDDLWEAGDVPAAILEYERALPDAQEHHGDDPGNRAAHRQIGVIEQRIGDGLTLLGRFAEALRHQQASLRIDQELHASDPNNAETRRDLGTDHTRLGLSYLATGDLAAALREYQTALDMRVEIYRADPTDTRIAWDVAESHDQIAKVRLRVGDPAGARAASERALELLRGLASGDPANVRWQDAMASTLANRADIERARGDSAAALAALSEAIRVRRRAAREHPDYAENLTKLAELEARSGPALE